MSKNNQSSRFPCFLVVIILILSGALIFGVVWAPTRAKALFGLSDNRLNLLEKSRSALAILAARDELIGNSAGVGKSGKFTIEADESVRGICLRMQTEGFVSSGDAVCAFLTYSGLDRMVQSGTFTISESFSALEVARRIADPAARDLSLTIFPGWRLEEIAEAVDASGFAFSGEEFLDYALHPTAVTRGLLGIPDDATLEGYLLPGAYSYEPQISLEAMTGIIVERFAAAVQETRVQEGLTRQNMSLHEAVILASIIERETRADEEKARIASVFYNRLAVDMRLETDPTVQYALGYDNATGSWWKSPLSLEDLTFDSAYNTYRNLGLPPGPISSPAIVTLIAALQPEETPFYFFRARCDGSGTHVFSVTYEEHLNNACP